MEKEIKLQLRIKNQEVVKKIYKVYSSLIPIQDLFETLLLQADLKHYKNILGIK